VRDEQVEYWNGPAAERWIRYQSALDHALRSYGNAALEMAAARYQERALDVGCGCGDSALALAEQVGPDGLVIGVDVSSAMLVRARERTKQVPQLQLIEADAATFRPEPPSTRFDLIFSRFGLMFFSDPTAAFRHLHSLLREHGRLAFVCWRSFADNAWASVPFELVQKSLPPSAANDIDIEQAPGPYSLADVSKLRQLLESTGFRDIEVERYDAMVIMAGDLERAIDFSINAGPAARLLLGAAPEIIQRAHDELARALAPHRVEGGYGLAGSSWLVRASA
jgi:ubiquinone/menaquinone biosynthesis C-methylase UbiE